MSCHGSGTGDSDPHRIERKRARDRQAQRHARARQQNYIRQLARELAHCKKYHSQGYPSVYAASTSEIECKHEGGRAAATSHGYLFDEMLATRRVTRQTKKRSDDRLQLRLNTFQTSLNSVTVMGNAAQLKDQRRGEMTEQEAERAQNGIKRTWIRYQPSTPVPPKPKWSDVPKSCRVSPLAQSWSPWLSCPDVLSTLPDVALPQELMYGARHNPIANAIFVTLSVMHYSEAERLAVGWLVYVYTKWVMDPTRERYQRIPEFMRPTQLQLDREHHAMYDYILWPHVRDNMIRNLEDNDMDEVFALWSVSLKCKWPATEQFLYVDDNDSLTIKPEFFARFTSIEGWSLAPQFAKRYPWLVS